ncbi:uncharacterized protein LOC110808335 [Carica papaya]|uniref:uncharacterized protein LOC110808335 n=1 Tax=Carica papaya TaxID=3649 RepID=UPI000B8CA9B3|nr:uncharacterized protein LOC110808335 [Carica papaya]
MHKELRVKYFASYKIVERFKKEKTFTCRGLFGSVQHVLGFSGRTSFEIRKKVFLSFSFYTLISRILFLSISLSSSSSINVKQLPSMVLARERNTIVSTTYGPLHYIYKMASWKKTITSPFRKACTFFNHQHQQMEKVKKKKMDVGADHDEKGVRNLHGQVMACGYEDVQVMWSILDKSKSEPNCNMSS